MHDAGAQAGGTSSPWVPFSVMIPQVSPCSVSLANAIASSVPTVDHGERAEDRLAVDGISGVTSVSTVAGMHGASRGGAAGQRGALGDRLVDQRGDPLGGVGADDRADRGVRVGRGSPHGSAVFAAKAR